MDPKTSDRAAARRPRRPGLAGWVLIGLLGGVACGLFFGEACAGLRVVGGAFIQLLQMTVLPYVTVSLVLGLGRLTYDHARRLALRGGLALLAIWGLTFAVILSLPLTFPARETASFFSTTLLQPSEAQDLLSLYVPANPFRALADGVVPAVVLFSLATGIALIAVRTKERLLDGLAALSEALTKVAMFVVRLTPIGIFGIAASAAGTMTLEEAGRLQVYLVAVLAGGALLLFWMLPALVSAVTPFRHRELLRCSRTALLTAFAAGNLFVVLPLLVESGKRLFGEQGAEARESVEVLVPIGFNFPNAGKLLLLLFVLFAAWFSGAGVEVGEYPLFLVSGLVSWFGHTTVAMPYMLDTLRIPADYFQLYILTALVGSRMAAAVGAMSLLALALISTAALAGIVRLSWGRVLRYALASAGLLLLTLAATRLLLEHTVSSEYTKDRVVARMQLLEDPAPAVVRPDPPPASAAGGLLARIQETGVIRAGFVADRLPLCYRNAAGDLVGFDVELIHRLARDMGVGIEFVPVEEDDLASVVARGLVDVVAASLPKTPDWAGRAGLSATTLEVTLAFVVPDHARKRFAEREALGLGEGLRIATVGRGILARRVEEILPEAEVVVLGSIRAFFERAEAPADALMTAAEVGSAWTLLHPRYAVVVPQPGVIRVPCGFAVPRSDPAWREYLDAWIELHRRTLKYQRAYDHWILGRSDTRAEPRWCVIRDVLGWVD